LNRWARRSASEQFSGERIPLDVKVVLIGEPLLYYLLYEFDPDFRELFKVAVDFEASVDRSDANHAVYAGVIGTLARRAELRPFSATGVARVLEHGARVVGDAGKLWLGLDHLTDLLREADYWAGVGQHAAVDATDVQRAIDARLERAGRPRDRLQEEIERGTIAIAISGDVTGQVNGLSVIELGGLPSRPGVSQRACVSARDGRRHRTWSSSAGRSTQRRAHSFRIRGRPVRADHPAAASIRAKLRGCGRRQCLVSGVICLLSALAHAVGRPSR
jgi:predicted ATP-dependent protease